MNTKKKLGQHFLIDKKIAERQVEYAQVNKKDVVLEIGPGRGILTKILAEKAKQVVAVEIDKHLIDKLRSSLPENVVLIHGDVLKTDFAALPVFNKIVSNLPFSISSPITFKILKHSFSTAILMYQKDFAQRMIAVPHNKNYSRLSVNIYYKTHCRILETISRNCFYPKPQVDSCIVELIPRVEPPFSVINEEFFFDLTKKLFNQRRKKIRNIIEREYGKKIDNLPYLNSRVEELKPEQIGELSNLLIKKIQT